MWVGVSVCVCVSVCGRGGGEEGIHVIFGFGFDSA